MVQGAGGPVDFTANTQGGQRSGDYTQVSPTNYDWIGSLANTARTLTAEKKQKDDDVYTGEYQKRVIEYDEMRQNGSMTDEELRMKIRDLDTQYAGALKPSVMNTIKDMYGWTNTDATAAMAKAHYTARADVAKDYDKQMAEIGQKSGVLISQYGVDAAIQAGKYTFENAQSYSNAAHLAATTTNEGNRAQLTGVAAQFLANSVAMDVYQKHLQKRGSLTPEDMLAFRQNIELIVDSDPQVQFPNGQARETFINTVMDNTFGEGTYNTYQKPDTFIEDQYKYDNNVLKARTQEALMNSLSGLAPADRQIVYTGIGLGTIDPKLAEQYWANNAAAASRWKSVSNMTQAIKTGDNTIISPDGKPTRYTYDMRKAISYTLNNPDAPESAKADMTGLVVLDKNAVIGKGTEEIVVGARGMNQADKQQTVKNADTYENEVYNTFAGLSNESHKAKVKENAAIITRNKLSVGATQLADRNFPGVKLIRTDTGFIPQATYDNLVEAKVAQGVPEKSGTALSNWLRENLPGNPLATGIANRLDSRGNMTTIVNRDEEAVFNLTRGFSTGTLNKEFDDYNKSLNESVSRATGAGAFSKDEIYNTAQEALTAMGFTVVDTNGHTLAVPRTEAQVQGAVDEVALVDTLKTDIKQFESGSKLPNGFSSPTKSYDGKQLLIGHGSRITEEKEFVDKMSAVTGRSEEELKEIYRSPEQRAAFTITPEQTEKLLEYELNKHTNLAKEFAGNSWESLPDALKMAIVDTSYEAGLGTVNNPKFPTLHKLLNKEDATDFDILRATLVRKGSSPQRQLAKIQRAVDEGLIGEKSMELALLLKEIQKVRA